MNFDQTIIFTIGAGASYPYKLSFGDKGETINYFTTLAMQHSQIWVGTGLMPANTKADGPNDVNWTGGFKGALAISPSDASPEEAPRSGDLETARLLGKRIAELSKIL